MKVLLLTQVVPYPPDSGPKIKTYHVLRWLAHAHEVTLVSFVRSQGEAAAAHQLRALCRAVHTVPLQRGRQHDLRALLRSLGDPRPFVLQRDESTAMRRTLQQVTAREQFDLVHADQINMAPFAFALDGLPVVLDLHNAVWTITERLAHDARGLRRWALLHERNRLRRYEAWACQQAAAVLAVSDADRRALHAVAGDVAIDVVPIALDVAAQPLIERHKNAHAALSIATMFWPPNVDGVCWFGRRVYPRVRQQRPDVPFHVVGARPARAVRRLAAQQPGIVVAGYVPDVAPWERQAAALVVPLRSGSGMRVKILEAWARGVPVVSTSIGAEGIAATPNEHLLIADEPPAFADAVVSLVRSPERGQRLVEAARAVAEQRYDWRVVCPAIDAAYTRAVHAPTGAAHMQPALNPHMQTLAPVEP